MSNDDLVTVGIATYNDGAYLKNAIDSALTQEHSNLEIIICDDGSTDNTAEIIDYYNDPRILYLTNTENMGIARTRQKIKDLAAGDWLVWLDSDDIFYPTRVARLLDVARETGADIVADSSGFIDAQGNRLPGAKSVPDYLAQDRCFTRLFERNRMIPHPLISRPCFTEVDFLPTAAEISEDYDFYLGASVKGFAFKHFHEVHYDYRVRKDSVSVDQDKLFSNVRKIFSKYPVPYICDLYRSRGYSEEQSSYMSCIQYMLRGDYNNAGIWVEESWPDSMEKVRAFYQGTIALHVKDYNTGLAYLRACLEQHPEAPAALNNIGMALAGLGEEDPYWFKRALNVFPAYMDARQNLEKPTRITNTWLSSGRIR